MRLYWYGEQFPQAVPDCRRYLFRVYNLIRRTNLPPDWEDYVIPDAPLLKLAGANSDPLRLSAVVRLVVRLGNGVYRLPFMVTDSLAVDFILGTAFIDSHIRSIAVDVQQMDLRRGDRVAILNDRGNNPRTGPRRIYPVDDLGKRHRTTVGTKRMLNRYGLRVGSPSRRCPNSPSRSQPSVPG